MDNKARIFLKVIETNSFSRAARELGYSQSAVSQSIHALETELGTILIERQKDGISLTEDGKQYYPYLQSIVQSVEDLEKKKAEMQGLVNRTIRIGTFTSVSRHLLPPLIQSFKQCYPDVQFELLQGEYNSIENWILEDKIDFGFVNPQFVTHLETRELYQDTMAAVLPKNHPLAKKDTISLKDLASEPFIELDEGDYSVAIEAFHQNHIHPNIQYKVTDDFSILTMIQNGFGVSMLYQLAITGFMSDAAIRPITEKFYRTIAIGYRNYDTLPLSSRRFIDHLIQNAPEILKTLKK